MEEVRKLMEKLREDSLAQDVYYGSVDAIVLMLMLHRKIRGELVSAKEDSVFTPVEVIEILDFILYLRDDLNKKYSEKHYSLR